VLAATTVAGVLVMACPAVADVKVEPTSAPQGSGQNVHFTVTNTGTSAITQLRLVMPKDKPVAEVFPLSVDDWAPRIEQMTLATPLTSAHNGTPVSQTAGAITWIAMPGRALPPGKSTELAAAMGPLPAATSMTFTFQATYADAKPGPALPPVALALVPAQPGQALGHGGHGGTTQGSDAATFAALAAQADDGPGFWSVAGWVLAGLALAAAAVLLMRGRRPTPPAPEEQADTEQEEKEPVAAGAPRVTSWSYRDGPDE
jgi:Domain of unkown function (DUF1775)